jgi:hypothetical protein
MSSTIARTAIPITHYRILTMEQPAATALLVAEHSSGAEAGSPLLGRQRDSDAAIGREDESTPGVESSVPARATVRVGSKAEPRSGSKAL